MSSDNNNIESLLKKLVKHQKQMNSLLSDVMTALGGSGDGAASEGSKKEKKPRKANAWSGWVKHAPASHADDFAKYREAHPEMKGHAIQFAKEWKESHTSEYETFVAEHAEKNSVVDGSASESEAAASAKPIAKKVVKKKTEKAAAAPAPIAEKPKIKRVIKKAISAPTSDASEAE
jgi:inhibitor of KinA sporulation pathway (predicted exonuclease)